MPTGFEEIIVRKGITTTALGIGGYVTGCMLQCLMNGESIGFDCIMNKVYSNLEDDAIALGLAAFMNSPAGTVLNQVPGAKEGAEHLLDAGGSRDAAKADAELYDHKSVQGYVPLLKCNSDQEGFQGLCYDKSDIPPGYDMTSLARATQHSCPDGLRDTGISCTEDDITKTKGRGGGYPNKLWEDGFSLDGARRRCEADNGRGNCEQNGLIIYPKCEHLFGPEYKSKGCCLCNRTYTKDSKYVPAYPVTSQCDPGVDMHDGVCYDISKADRAAGWEYAGLGDFKKRKAPKSSIDGAVDGIVNKIKTAEDMIPETLGIIGALAGLYFG